MVSRSNDWNWHEKYLCIFFNNRFIGNPTPPYVTNIDLSDEKKILLFEHIIVIWSLFFCSFSFDFHFLKWRDVLPYCVALQRFKREVCISFLDYLDLRECNAHMHLWCSVHTHTYSTIWKIQVFSNSIWYVRAHEPASERAVVISSVNIKARY